MNRLYRILILSICSFQLSVPAHSFDPEDSLLRQSLAPSSETRWLHLKSTYDKRKQAVFQEMLRWLTPQALQHEQLFESSLLQRIFCSALPREAERIGIVRPFTSLPEMTEQLIDSVTVLTLNEFNPDKRMDLPMLSATVQTADSEILVSNEHHVHADPVIQAFKQADAEREKTLLVISDLHHDNGYGSVNTIDGALRKDPAFSKGEKFALDFEPSELLLKNNWILDVLDRSSCDYIIQVVPGKGQFHTITKRFIHRPGGPSKSFQFVVTSLDNLSKLLKQAKSKGYQNLCNSMDLDATAGSFSKESEYHDVSYDIESLSEQAQKLFRLIYENPESEDVKIDFVLFWKFLTKVDMDLHALSFFWSLYPEPFPDDFSLEEALKEICHYLQDRSEAYYRQYFRILKNSGLQPRFQGFALSPGSNPLPDSWILLLQTALHQMKRVNALKFISYRCMQFVSENELRLKEGFDQLLRFAIKGSKAGDRTAQFLMDLRDQLLEGVMGEDIRNNLRNVYEVGAISNRFVTLESLQGNRDPVLWHKIKVEECLRSA